MSSLVTFGMLNARIHLLVMLGDHYVFKGVVLCCFLFIYYLFYAKFPFKLVESLNFSRQLTHLWFPFSFLHPQTPVHLRMCFTHFWFQKNFHDYLLLLKLIEPMHHNFIIGSLISVFPLFGLSSLPISKVI